MRGSRSGIGYYYFFFQNFRCPRDRGFSLSYHSATGTTYRNLDRGHKVLTPTILYPGEMIWGESLVRNRG